MSRVVCLVEHGEEPVVSQFLGTCAFLDAFPETPITEALVVQAAVPAFISGLTTGMMAETIEGHADRITILENECTALETLEPAYTIQSYRIEPRECGHHTGRSWGGEYVITPRAHAVIRAAENERKLIKECAAAATRDHHARYSLSQRLFANKEANGYFSITVAPWLLLSHRLKEVIQKTERIMKAKQVADGSDHGRCPGCNQRDRLGP